MTYANNVAPGQPHMRMLIWCYDVRIRHVRNVPWRVQKLKQEASRVRDRACLYTVVRICHGLSRTYVPLLLKSLVYLNIQHRSSIRIIMEY